MKAATGSEKEFFVILHKDWKKGNDGLAAHIQSLWNKKNHAAIFYITGINFSFNETGDKLAASVSILKKLVDKQTIALQIHQHGIFNLKIAEKYNKLIEEIAELKKQL